MIQLPDFNTVKERNAYLVANKAHLIAQKKYEMKRGDTIAQAPKALMQLEAGKAASEDVNELNAELIINTTNWLDSHKDVHIPGLWAKSLQENKSIYHLQEHVLSFKNIISDEVTASAKNYTWRELGYDMDGTTQALVFNSKIRKERNAFMFGQYRKGYVKQHSVGMQYVKLVLCINDEDYGAEHEAWQKYYPEIANKEAADETGYFWAVTEAKVIEGSAVPLGSNQMTPTLSVEENKGEPRKHSSETEPPAGTRFNVTEALQTLKINL